MDEKKWNTRSLCSIIGMVALLIYIIITVVGSNEYLLVLRVLFAGIAALSNAIRLGIAISCHEISNCIFLIGIICMCLFIILIIAMQFV